METTNKRQLIFISCRPTVWGHQPAGSRPQCDTIHQVSLTYSAYFRSSRKQRKEFSLKAARQSAASFGRCARNVCAPLSIVRGRHCEDLLVYLELIARPRAAAAEQHRAGQQPGLCLAHQIMCGLQIYDYLIFPPVSSLWRRW